MLGTQDQIRRSTSETAPAAGGSSTEHVLQLLIGPWIGRSVFAAVKLGVIDALSSGPSPSGDIAAEVGADPDAVRRLIGLLCAVDLVAESGDGFVLTAHGHLLRSDVAHSLGALAQFYAEDYVSAAWSNLEHAIRTGESGFEQTFGKSVFSHVAAEPSRLATFVAGIAAGGLRGEVARTLRLHEDAKVIDVGGGDGGLLLDLLHLHPNARGVVFELPEVIASASDEILRHGLTDRCEAVAGDFFVDDLPSAEVYLLSRIIHDWGDADSQHILQNCWRSAPPSARLVLVERVKRQASPSPLTAAFDLHMMVMTGGSERTEAQYRDLLGRSGFAVEQVVEVVADLCIIEARRQGPRQGS